jgi:hypothetical protein
VEIPHVHQTLAGGGDNGAVSVLHILGEAFAGRAGIEPFE